MKEDDTEVSRRAEAKLVIFRQLFLAKLAAYKVQQQKIPRSTKRSDSINRAGAGNVANDQQDVTGKVKAKDGTAVVSNGSVTNLGQDNKLQSETSMCNEFVQNPSDSSSTVNRQTPAEDVQETKQRVPDIVDNVKNQPESPENDDPAHLRSDNGECTKSDKMESFPNEKIKSITAETTRSAATSDTRSRSFESISADTPSSLLHQNTSSTVSEMYSENDAKTLSDVIDLLKSGRDDLTDTYRINHITNILRKKRRARLKEATLKGQSLTVDSKDMALLKYLLILQMKAQEKRERDGRFQGGIVPRMESQCAKGRSSCMRNSTDPLERFQEEIVPRTESQCAEGRSSTLKNSTTPLERSEDVSELIKEENISEYKEEVEGTKTPEAEQSEELSESDEIVKPVKTKSKHKKRTKRNRSNVKKPKTPMKVTKAQRDVLLREALREATGERLRLPLEEAILDFLHFKVKDKDGDLPKAMAKLDVIKTQIALEDALEKGNTERVQYALNYCNRRDYDDVMKPVLRRATTFMLQASQTEDTVFNTRKVVKNSSEIRRYNHPQDIIHAVTKATLLLLQEPEGRTKRWIRCQALLTPLGNNGLYKKTRRFEVDAVHSQIVARAKDLICDIHEEDVMGSSECLEALYKWSKAMIEEYEIRNGPIDNVRPASRRSQRTIIRKQTGEGKICKDTYKPLVLPVLAYVNRGGDAMDMIQKLPQWSTPRQLKIPAKSVEDLRRKNSIIKTGKTKTKVKQKKEIPDSRGSSKVADGDINDGDIQMKLGSENNGNTLIDFGGSTVNDSSGSSSLQSGNKSRESGLDMEFSDQGASGLFNMEASDVVNDTNIVRRRRSRSHSLIISSDGWKQEKLYPSKKRGSLLPMIDQKPLVTRKD